MNQPRARVALAALAVLLALPGCAQAAPQPEPSAVPTTSITARPTSEYDPDATAEQALDYFDHVNAATLPENPDAGGRDFIDGLVSAGFDTSAMEVTKDLSTVGNEAESIQFSVRWGDECLVGQYGSAVDGYHSAVLDVLGTGTCLVGQTRPVER